MATTQLNLRTRRSSSNGNNENGDDDDDDVQHDDDDDSNHEVSDSLRKHREMIHEMKQKYRVSIIQRRGIHHCKSRKNDNNVSCTDIIVQNQRLTELPTNDSHHHKVSLSPSSQRIRGKDRQRSESTKRELLLWKKEGSIRRVSQYVDEDYCRLFCKNQQQSPKITEDLKDNNGDNNIHIIKYETGCVEDTDERFFDSFDVLVDDEEKLCIDEFFDCVPGAQFLKNIEEEPFGNSTSPSSMIENNEEDDCEDFVDSFSDPFPTMISSTKEVSNTNSDSHLMVVTDDVYEESTDSLEVKKDRSEKEVEDTLDPAMLAEDDANKIDNILDNFFETIDSMDDDEKLDCVPEKISFRDGSFDTADKKKCMKFDNRFEDESENAVTSQELIVDLSIDEESNRVEVVNNEEMITEMITETIRGCDQIIERMPTVLPEESEQDTCDVELHVSPIQKYDNEQEEIDKVLTDFLLSMDSLDDDDRSTESIPEQSQGLTLDFSSRILANFNSPIGQSPNQSPLRIGDDQSDFTSPVRAVVDKEDCRAKDTLQSKLSVESESYKSRIKTDSTPLSFKPLNESRSRITSPDLNQSINSSAGIFLSISTGIESGRPHDPVAKALSRDSSENMEAIVDIQDIPCEATEFERKLIGAIESNPLQELNGKASREDIDPAAKIFSQDSSENKDGIEDIRDFSQDSSENKDGIEDIRDIPCEAIDFENNLIGAVDSNPPQELLHESSHENFDPTAKELSRDSSENQKAAEDIQDISTKATEFENKSIGDIDIDSLQELNHKSTYDDLSIKSDEDSNHSLPSFEQHSMSTVSCSPVRLKESGKNSNCYSTPASQLKIPVLHMNSDEAVKSPHDSQTTKSQSGDEDNVLSIATPPPISKSRITLFDISTPEQPKTPRTAAPFRTNPSNIPFYRTRERLSESRSKQRQKPTTPHKVETSRSSYGGGGSTTCSVISWYGSPGRSIARSSSIPGNNRNLLDISSSSFREGDNKSKQSSLGSTNKVEICQSPLRGESNTHNADSVTTSCASPDRSSSIRSPLRGFHSLASPIRSPTISLYSKMPHGARSTIRRLQKLSQTLDDDLLSVDTIRVCANKFAYNLHPKRGPCNRCWSLASFEEQQQYKSRGSHLRITQTRSGCDRSCTIFPPMDDDDAPVRLCRQCFFATHQDENGCKLQVYRGNHIKVQSSI
jgi:hypothetical protein